MGPSFGTPFFGPPNGRQHFFLVWFEKAHFWLQAKQTQ
jgi:hypothetical protein